MYWLCSGSYRYGFTACSAVKVSQSFTPLSNVMFSHWQDTPQPGTTRSRLCLRPATYHYRGLLFIGPVGLNSGLSVGDWSLLHTSVCHDSHRSRIQLALWGIICRTWKLKCLARLVYPIGLGAGKVDGEENYDTFRPPIGRGKSVRDACEGWSWAVVAGHTCTHRRRSPFWLQELLSDFRSGKILGLIGTSDTTSPNIVLWVWPSSAGVLGPNSICIRQLSCGSGPNDHVTLAAVD